MRLESHIQDLYWEVPHPKCAFSLGSLNVTRCNLSERQGNKAEILSKLFREDLRQLMETLVSYILSHKISIIQSKNLLASEYWIWSAWGLLTQQKALGKELNQTKIPKSGFMLNSGHYTLRKSTFELWIAMSNYKIHHYIRMWNM